MHKPLLIALLLAGCSTPQVLPPQNDAALHRQLLTLDTHLDTPDHFRRPSWDFGAAHPRGDDLAQVDLGRMDSGALDGGFFVIYTPQGPVTPEGFAAAKAFALGRMGEIETTLAKFPGRIGLATRAGDAARLDAAGKRIAFVSIENSYPLGEDLGLLDEFYRRGVRMASPVHFRNNQFADSATDSPKWNGLSPLGRQWLAEVNRLGIVADASHASDAVLDQMLALSKAPIIASHSGSRSVYDHPRNLDDARVRKLAAAGGAICVNSVYMGALPPSTPERDALHDQWDKVIALAPIHQVELARKIHAVDAARAAQGPDFETYMRNVLHLIEVAGVDHVCFGADWDGGGGVPGMEDITALPKVTARLRAAGYGAADLQKMWSGNVLRLVRIADERKGR